MLDQETLEDEEFRRQLRRVLKKPMRWYPERADRLVRGATRGRQRTVRLHRKGWGSVFEAASQVLGERPRVLSRKFEAAGRGNRLESEDVSNRSASIGSISRSQDDRRGGNLSAGRGGEFRPTDV